MPLFPGKKIYIICQVVLSESYISRNDSYFHVSGFQVAAKKRSKRHLAETDEYITSTIEGTLLDTDAMSTAYQKMTSLCMNFKNEIFTDIQIHNQDVLPRYNIMISLVLFTAKMNIIRPIQYHNKYNAFIWGIEI